MTIKTITVPRGQVVSVNVESGIAVGTSIEITNESILYAVHLTTSLTEPAANKTDKKSLTSRRNSDATGIVPQGSLEVWAYAHTGTITLSVQEI